MTVDGEAIRLWSRHQLLALVISAASCFAVFAQQIQPPRLARNQDYEEICQTESFRASCRGDNEVVVMSKALYGRMRLQSRCIERNYGYIGCSHDVIGSADAMCSGRHSCHFYVPNGDFEAAVATTCPRDFKMYLEASYRCQTVVTGDASIPCQPPAVYRLTAREGYIASAVSDATSRGTAQCPWLIQGRRGQRINITLWDFAAERYSSAQRAATSSSAVIPQAASQTCHAYAVIRERTPARSVTICGEGHRVSEVYNSSSESVEVRVLPARVDKDQLHTLRHFILRYEIYGCSELDPESTDQWYRRHGNRMEVGCTGSAATWWLECNGFEWIGPSINCSTAGDAMMEMKLSRNQLPSATTSLVAMTAIAIALSVLIVAGGLIILTCRRRSADNSRDIDRQDVYYRTGIKSLPPTTLDHCNSPHTQSRPSLPHHPDFQHHPQFYNATTVSYPLLMHQQQQQQPENEYSYIADLQQPPTPTSGGHVISASGWRSEHVTGSVAGISPGDGVNLSRPVAVIPGLARDDKLRLPQRLALKGTADHYHQKSELSGDVDADAAVSDCATISVRGVAPSNSIKSAGGCIGSTNVTDYQVAAV